MEKDLPGPMTPFDELVTSPELQLMKLLIPYAPASGRQMLAAFVKFTELQETLRLFRRPGGLRAQGFPDDARDEPPSPFDILNSFRPYLPPQQASMLDTVMNLRNMLSIMEMMQAQQEQNQEPANPMDLLSGMLSPEQQEMFRMYSDFIEQSAETSPDTTSDTVSNDRNVPYNIPKGDDDHERMDEQSGNEKYRSDEAGADPDGRGENLRQVRPGSGPGYAGSDHERQ